ncbi:hypothetical protein OIU78_010968 [Salix suchowensis]|nr:hypothetical protein OIU78_010968 [Salix suchowensis]
MNFLQSKKERQRSKSSYDPSDVVGTSSEEGYIGASKKSQYFGRYSGGSVDSDGGRKWSSNPRINPDSRKDLNYVVGSTGLNSGSRPGRLENMDNGLNFEGLLTTGMDINGLMSSEPLRAAEGYGHGNDALSDIPQILHLICNGNDESPTSSKRGALQQLIEASVANDPSVWSKYFNQILTSVLEVLDDSDSSIRELALSLILEMLRNQKDAMEDSIEIAIEKLLHVTEDIVPKVSNEAEHCLTVALSQYDPFRCLSVIVPLLVTEDEKTLVTCINCLTKLVGRLSQEELTVQLPSFLPALFEAFGNQSADVRKTVVFCLVDIYIMLGKAFLPHLEGLNSTQLRLVTIYANRISQARTGEAWKRAILETWF